MLLLLGLLFSAKAQQYCSSGPTTTVDSNLGATVLIGDQLTISDDSNCPGTIGPKDLTAMTADVSSRTYTLTTTVTTCGNSFPTLAAAWIDWGQDYVWDDSDRLGAYSVNKNNVSWSFTVPAWAVQGKTRMRVQVQETQATSLSPCASFPYGATKDYSINVNMGPPPPPPPPPPPTDPLCVSGPLTIEDANLGAVTLIGWSKNIRDTSDCPGKTGVQNFLALVADVYQGDSYTLTFNVTTCGDNFITLAAAWIDWDQDHVLTSADLLAPYTRQKGLVSVAFTVPVTQWTGDTVMRVQVQETESTKMDPCAAFSYGSTKDFTVNVNSRKPSPSAPQQDKA